MEGGGRLEGGDACGRRFFLDRSKLRVLLCDKDPKSSQEILRLLNNCTYQVDLPIAKGLKMLKCIARKKEWRRIPIIMMSSQDEVSVVVKCLRLGAADYLVKPLRTNELLNLWTHTWRRRHMLGQAEKDIFNQEIGFILSEPSDANTNSTSLLSEDTDEMGRTTNQEVTLLDQREYECSQFDTSPVEPNQNILSEDDALQNANHAVCAGNIFSWPRKMVLKVGQSSAFLNYVNNSRAPTSNSPISHVDRVANPSDLLNGEEKKNLLVGGSIEDRNCWDDQESHSLENSVPISENVSNRSMLEASNEFPIVCHNSPTDVQLDVPGMQSMFHAPIYLHGQPSSMQGWFQGTSYDLNMKNPASLIHHYNLLRQSHHAPMIQNFAYHPVGISLPSEHMPPPAHLWSSSSTSHAPQSKTGPTERRAAALMKFKKKKKVLCYDKNIRYINRKRLAEKRPRVRGQFVRQVNGVDIQQAESPAMKDFDSDEEEDEPLSRESELASPDNDTFSAEH